MYIYIHVDTTAPANALLQQQKTFCTHTFLVLAFVFYLLPEFVEENEQLNHQLKQLNVTSKKKKKKKQKWLENILTN